MQSITSCRRKQRRVKKKNKQEIERKQDLLRRRAERREQQRREATKPPIWATQPSPGSLPKLARRDPSLLQSYEALQKRFRFMLRVKDPAEPPELLKLARTYRFWTRPLEHWNPRGAPRRSQERLLRSLIDHLLLRYPVPLFLYQAFQRSIEHSCDPAWMVGWRQKKCEGSLMPPWLWVFLRLAQGASLFKLLRDDLGLPINRRGAHHFMQMEENMGIMQAYRSAQVLNHGGSPALGEAVCNSFLERGFKDDEPFYDEVLSWMSRQELKGEMHQVAPLLDYLKHLRTQKGVTFQMKGRSLGTLVRGMWLWHENLRRFRLGFRGIPLPEDGFQMMRWSPSEQNEEDPENTPKTVWEMSPIREEIALVEEGRAMHHCVASYLNNVHMRQCSIWSLRCNQARRLTVELRLLTREIVQARGAYNRMPTSIERDCLKRWAQHNGLTLRGAI